ncbi:EscU/YscU/HrcU family type III secretion system export apparatus switch protein [Gallaecimonas mangrovi]|uniref:EscU/YscU/HrcU family type III secretion system export apparatus switch protein n=1 Tax=Gallaecimonas mangrovi TaxID=2291597 RepID=UPI000E20046F|nr:EscU/YscU/HrcU family type III secretion system export apparatus switch protein [Gallaecimonas mangrovi]
MMTDEKQQSAVGLSYDGKSPPKLDFKISGDQARALIEKAQEQGLLLHEDPALLATLMRLEEGDAIAPQLYQIVAELIAYAWLLMGKEPEYWRTPAGGIRAKG